MRKAIAAKIYMGMRAHDCIFFFKNILKINKIILKTISTFFPFSLLFPYFPSSQFLFFYFFFFPEWTLAITVYSCRSSNQAPQEHSSPSPLFKRLCQWCIVNNFIVAILLAVETISPVFPVLDALTTSLALPGDDDLKGPELMKSLACSHGLSGEPPIGAIENIKHKKIVQNQNKRGKKDLIQIFNFCNA